MSNAQALYRNMKEKGIIMSCGSSDSMVVRGPYDVTNLLSVCVCVCDTSLSPCCLLAHSISLWEDIKIGRKISR